MIHITDDGHTIDCNKVYTYIKMKGIESQSIPIKSITHKGLSNISTNDLRYLRATVELPGIVVEEESCYKLIDGRHRLLRAINDKRKDFVAYVISHDEAMKFV